MENKTFRYTYSAKEQSEIQKIRGKYLTPEENGIDRLRKLDAGVTQKACVYALVIGILGALILGTGMSLAMTDIGAVVGLNEQLCMLAGIAVGIVGLVLVALAYPIYNRVVKKERARVAPEILRLSDELLK